MLLTKSLFKYLTSFSLNLNNICLLLLKYEYLISLQFFFSSLTILYSDLLSGNHSVNTLVLKCMLMLVYPLFTCTCRKNIYCCQLLNQLCSDQNQNLTMNIFLMLTAIKTLIFKICLYKSSYMFTYYSRIFKYYSVWVI